MKDHFGLLAALCSVVLTLAAPSALYGQSQPPTVAAPTLFRMTGTLQTPTGEPRTGGVVLVASLYNAQADVSPLWTEAQPVMLEPTGRYSVLIGSTLEGGVPMEFFLSGSGRWLGIGVQGEAEQARVMLITVPYALKAVEADRLSGKTASDFVLAQDLGSSMRTALAGSPSPSLGPLITSTTNAIAKFTDGAGTVGNSVISESASNIGIGTAVPSAKLDVTAVETSTIGTSVGVNIQDGNARNIGDLYQVGFASVFPNKPQSVFGAVVTSSWSYGKSDLFFATRDVITNTAPTERMRITSNGSVGIGTMTPNARLDVTSSETTTIGNSLALNIQDANARNIGDLYQIGFASVSPSKPQAVFGAVVTSSWSYGKSDLFFATRDVISDTAPSERMRITSAGNVGIGTTSPTAKLDVAGNINVSGNINAKYQDVAEWVETTTPLEAGTVVTVDPKAPNRVVASSKAYDTRVAGAVSKQPGLILGEAGDSKAMVAQSGRVRVKVDARYGAIRVGDLLVTSPTPGYAMRSRPVMVGGVAVHRAGTLVGKALEALPSGKGEILVLLTLQ